VVLDAGASDTRAALGRFAGAPLRTFVPWAAGAAALAVLMLGAALVIGSLSRPGDPFLPVFLDPSAGVDDFVRVLGRNLLVLLLESLVCLAVYLSSRSLPLHAKHSRGLSRSLHARASGIALGVVIALAIYAFAWQAWRLGHDVASAAQTLHLSQAGLLARLGLHAVPELTAVFLPLSAAVLLCRRGRRDDLAAAAVVSGLAAIPVLAIAAGCEVWVTRALF
jgi:hypothetical protein